MALASAIGLTSDITAGTMTYSRGAASNACWHRFDFTAAMVVALGAVTTGEITVCTLPLKTIVKDAYWYVSASATGANLTACSMSMGRTGAAYIDYLTAQDIFAAAPLVYGVSAGQRGANLTGYDMPSYVAPATATEVKAQFVGTWSDGSKFNTAGAFATLAGSIFLRTETLF